jgi:hypothetical protein
MLGLFIDEDNYGNKLIFETNNESVTIVVGEGCTYIDNVGVVDDDEYGLG